MTESVTQPPAQGLPRVKPERRITRWWSNIPLACVLPLVFPAWGLAAAQSLSFWWAVVVICAAAGLSICLTIRCLRIGVYETDSGMTIRGLTRTRVIHWSMIASTRVQFLGRSYAPVVSLREPDYQFTETVRAFNRTIRVNESKWFNSTGRSSDVFLWWHGTTTERGAQRWADRVAAMADRHRPTGPTPR